MTSKDRPSNETIKPIIEKLALQDTPIVITRLIQGMCFKQKVKIVSVSGDFVVFQTPDIRFYVSNEGHFILHSPLFAGPVSAHQMCSNVPGGIFVLSDFAYLANKYTDRYQDRVEPQAPTFIPVTCNQKRIVADLMDINPAGIGVYAQKRLTNWANLASFEDVFLDIRFSPGFVWTNLRGVVMNLGAANPLQIRMGIQLKPTASQAWLLWKYFDQRRREILEGIDSAFGYALEPRKVEDLFF